MRSRAPASVAKAAPGIGVLAGVNGAGKSSLAGAFLHQAGGEFFNPDEAAPRILAVHPGLPATEANSLAWRLGLQQLQDAVWARRDYWFETTLGGKTITATLAAAAKTGLAVRVWYIGLDSPERCMARVAARVKCGGHAIPEELIRQRYDSSRLNLIKLLPQLAELVVFDNSAEADPAEGQRPNPAKILQLRGGKVLNPDKLQATPDWAKPIVAAALKIGHLQAR
ncbi:MAG: zeta toxin family protein [Gammaproteobacteria bacterium]|nr:zeta toxin family protein [Gammaproteobacteria bacterium]